jgi:hypothetical protein
MWRGSIILSNLSDQLSLNEITYLLIEKIMNIIDNFILMRKKFIKDEIIFLKLLYELILGLRDPDSSVRANNAEAIKSLVEAGLITPVEVKGRIPLDELFSGLHDLRSYKRVGNAEAIKSLVEAGLITPVEVKGRIPLDELFSDLHDLRSYKRVGSAKAIKSLVEAGFITPAEVKGKIPLDKLFSSLHDSDLDVRTANTKIIKSLAKIGLVTPAAVREFNLNKKEVEKVFLEVYGKPISYDFYYYYLSLLTVLRDDKDAVYRIFDYLQKDLVELLYICTNSMVENFFCQRLAQIIKEGKSVSQAKNILEEELQDKFTKVIIDSKGLRYEFIALRLGKLITQILKGKGKIVPDKLRKAFRLWRIEFRDGGNTSITISKIAEGVFVNSPFLELEKPPVQPPVFESKKLSDIPIKEGQVFKTLLKDAQVYKVLGRTLIYRTKAGGYIGIKFLKHSKITLPNGKVQMVREDPGKLIYESKFLDYLNRLKKEGVGLAAIYPDSSLIGDQRVVRIQQDEFSEEIKEKLEEFAFQSAKHNEESKVDTTDGYFTLMTYTINTPDYFSYLYEAEDNQIGDSTQKNIHDLFVLAKYGLIHPDIIELFHNIINIGRLDRGRYFWMIDIIRPASRRSGAGRLHAWEKTVEYPNMRLSGPSDFSEMVTLDELIALTHPHSISMQNNLQRFSPKGRKKIILANSIGNYLLAWVLNEGKRLKRKNKLTWQDAEEMSTLAESIRRVYSTAYQAFTERSDTDISGLIDWNIFAKQMAFFMTDAYIVPLQQKNLPTDLYSPDTFIEYELNIETSRGWTYKGWMLDGENPDLGPVNGPIPLQELIKANHVYTMFMVCRGCAPTSTTFSIEEKNLSNSAPVTVAYSSQQTNLHL